MAIDELLNEYEQSEKVRGWLRNNALGLIGGVGLGLALIAGWQTRIAALVLAAFTLVASVFFHAFWSVPADQAFVQQLMFFKNIAVIGGLLVLASQAPAGWTLDARRAV